MKARSCLCFQIPGPPPAPLPGPHQQMSSGYAAKATVHWEIRSSAPREDGWGSPLHRRPWHLQALKSLRMLAGSKTEVAGAPHAGAERTGEERGAQDRSSISSLPPAAPGTARRVLSHPQNQPGAGGHFCFRIRTPRLEAHRLRSALGRDPRLLPAPLPPLAAQQAGVAGTPCGQARASLVLTSCHPDTQGPPRTAPWTVASPHPSLLPQKALFPQAPPASGLTAGDHSWMVMPADGVEGVVPTEGAGTECDHLHSPPPGPAAPKVRRH